jgi:predicted secreted hydrolase
MRHALATLLALSVLAGSARAATLEPVQLPRDHGAHPQFGVEWWYTTGHASAPGGRGYFWFATIWTSPMGSVGRVNVVDLRRDRVVLARQWTQPGQFASGTTDLAAGDLRIRWTAGGRYGRLAVDARVDGGDRLRLRLVPRRPYALHGDHGVVRQGASGAAAYYSGTRLRGTGSLTVSGRKRRLAGRAWFDHQWGDFATSPGALRWDWFACQLDDGRDLMLTQFLGPDFQPLPGVQQGTLVDRHGRARPVTSFTATPAGRTLQPAGATTTYPLDWRLRVPSAGIELSLRAAARNQFVPMQLLPSFWEGAARIVHGPAGVCTVENSREAPAG